SIPDANVELPDFSTVRADRDTKACGKRKGGGLALYVNKQVVQSWASLWLNYKQHPEALLLISGDFNHVTLDNTLAAFHQYVDCNTRGKRTLDLMYANVKDAYRATPLPALGKADHNLVLLKPHYTPRVRRLPTTTRSFRKWSPEAEQALKDCFETTDWEALQGSHNGNMEEMVDCTTDYINFCMDTVVPVRSVRCFANNKPWITSDIKGLLNQKKKAFKDGWRHTQELKQIQKELRVQLREAKEQYRRKIEQRMQNNNMREVWEGMKTITGCSSKRGAPIEGDVGRANQLNQFFNREKTGVEDAIIFLLHRSLSHLDRGSGAVRITFLDFSSAFNTIQPLLLRDKLTEMGVGSHLVAWITDYLTGRPQYVRLGDCRSDTVASSTGAPQGTVLSPVLFTLYTSDFQYKSELCHVQKFADDTAIVGCIRSGQEDEYRELIKDFVTWCDSEPPAPQHHQDQGDGGGL
ncbi:hypothetical protein L3Q82_020036, partial [Scortum barcoo]